MKIFLSILGRIFVSIIFIASGINKLLEWENTEIGVTKVLADWGQWTTDSEVMQSFVAQLSPYADVLVVCAVVLEIVGGLMLLLGIKTRFAGFLLFLFMLPATILFHAFWFYEDDIQKMQMVMFLKNLAIIGGLFYIMAFGSGKKDKKNDIYRDS